MWTFSLSLCSVDSLCDDLLCSTRRIDSSMCRHGILRALFAQPPNTKLTRQGLFVRWFQNNPYLSSMSPVSCFNCNLSLNGAVIFQKTLTQGREGKQQRTVAHVHEDVYSYACNRWLRSLSSDLIGWNANVIGSPAAFPQSHTQSLGCQHARKTSKALGTRLRLPKEEFRKTGAVTQLTFESLSSFDVLVSLQSVWNRIHQIQRMK